ncbi:GNAT family N-acetyltransferase [Rhodobacteraceae bacterium NNCM2]|nr:GNAT family N-acetyltransferase [Coraliihabitans acroporae]
MTANQFPPVLETARLRLRPHLPGDFEASAALWSDPDVVRFISATPSTREASWSRLLRYIGQWQVSGFGYWVAETRETGAFVGEVGFADYRRAIDPDLGRMPEAGWVLSPRFHRAGYASEAAARMLEWADTALDHGQSFCIFDPAHHASIRVARKLGYGGDVMGTYGGGPTLILTRPRGGAA